MKTLTLFAGLALSSGCFGQGTVYFSTRVGATVDAPVTYFGELVDSRFLGQLYVGAPNGNLAPSGSGTPFRSDAGRGYITSGGLIEVPEIVAGEFAQVKLVVWAGSLGATYAEAVAKDVGGVGESSPITIRVGGGIIPPATLEGLRGFEISIPEPPSALLGCWGLGLLWTLKRRR
ncbi:MAG: hypothetical protein JNK85_08570 [Verrucomicrobiales bacterium]|nr:hypothetical protein [Verrucomicrobiales bacterium]